MRKSENNRLIILLTFLIVVLILCFGAYSYINANSPKLDEETTSLIEEYISEEYDISCKLINHTYTHNEIGITGGLYMYDFKLRTSSGKIVNASYMAYSDISKDTIHLLKIK